jgi:hypothetical protein
VVLCVGCHSLARGFAPLLEQALGMWQERQTGGAERDPARVAAQQRRAQVSLQLADLLAEHRLGDVQALGRSGEAQLLGNRDKVAQVAQVHVHSR